jgi:hypothetical protein
MSARRCAGAASGPRRVGIHARVAVILRAVIAYRGRLRGGARLRPMSPLLALRIPILDARRFWARASVLGDSANADLPLFAAGYLRRWAIPLRPAASGFRVVKHVHDLHDLDSCRPPSPALRQSVPPDTVRAPPIVALSGVSSSSTQDRAVNWGGVGRHRVVFRRTDVPPSTTHADGTKVSPFSTFSSDAPGNLNCHETIAVLLTR